MVQKVMKLLVANFYKHTSKTVCFKWVNICEYHELLVGIVIKQLFLPCFKASTGATLLGHVNQEKVSVFSTCAEETTLGQALG